MSGELAERGGGPGGERGTEKKMGWREEGGVLETRILFPYFLDGVGVWIWPWHGQI